MKLYRFSPIKSERQLLKAIKHANFESHKLCKMAMDKHLPINGNIGVFCHYDGEYEFLKKLREKLTEPSDNPNQKYFKLHKPITFRKKGEIPETVYTHLYIRKPDPYRHHVGDIDFVISKEEYKKLKDHLSNGGQINKARVFPRADLDMIELSDPDIDVLAYVSPAEESEKARIKVVS